MKFYRTLIAALMQFIFAVVIGLNGSQVCFIPLVSGLVTCLYAIRFAQQSSGLKS